MIKRTILPGLEEHLDSDQMTVITGPRQVGKTYLMNVLREKLKAKHEKTVWLNLDNEEDKRHLTSQVALISYVDLIVGRRKGYVFIDEIQRKENAGLFLKGIFDMRLPHKFIISGSGSLELKSKIPESMAGRKRLFTVTPVGFEEFVHFKTGYRHENQLEKFFSLERGLAGRLLSEYMSFGGYPRVILADSASNKQAEMQEIYRSYIDRDIRDLLHLEKTVAFADLLKILASQIGGIINVRELSSTVSIDQKTTKQYLYYLEQTYIIKKITPFWRNTRKEITKAPVYYFIDPGLRNWLLGLFGIAEIPRSMSGHLFENVVLNILMIQTELFSTQIHFWRTKDQAEVDFVLKTGQGIIPIEVKYTTLVKPELPRSFQNFITKYRPVNGYIVHLGKLFQAEFSGTRVSFLPYTDLFTSSLLLTPAPTPVHPERQL